jgi:hypothetical protein
LETTKIGIGQLGEALPDRFGMIGHAEHLFLMHGADIDHALTLRRSDPFDTAARKLRIAVHIEQTVFKTRRTKVGHKDLHGILSYGIRDWRLGIGFYKTNP